MKLVPIFFLLLLCVENTYAQKYFKPENMIETGVYYYPEAWNPDQWERDIKHL